MRAATLFSGIMAPEQARPDFDWIWCAEIEPFPCSLIKHHRPNVPNLGDVTKITEEQVKAYGPLDLVVFGSPCQDLSIAGKREGLSGARSGLFFTAINIIRWSGARFALWENVPGAYSSNEGADFAAVVGALSGLEPDVPEGGWRNTGAFVGPAGLVEWATLDAQWFGVPQRRRRVFALADFGDWSGRPPILLEPYGLSGHTPPRREAGKGSAGAAHAGIVGSLAARDQKTVGNQFVNEGKVFAVPGVSHCLNAGGMGRIDAESETFIAAEACPALRSGGNQTGGDRPPGTDVDTCESLVVARATGEVTHSLDSFSSGRMTEDSTGRGCPIVTTHSLRAEGFDASEDGTGRGTPLVPCVGATLKGNSGRMHIECDYIPVPILEAGARTGKSTDDIRAGIGIGEPGDPMFTLQSGKQHAVGCGGGTSRKSHAITGMAVRRLTPIECERLQGFSDNYTAIPHRGKVAADGPRYKALGNSMAVPVLRWILDRIEANA